MELIYGLPGGSVPSAPSFLERGASRASVRGPQWRSPSRFRPKNTIVQGFTLIGCLLAASFSRGGKFHTAQVSVLMVFCGFYFPLPLLFVLSTFRLLSILSRSAGGGLQTKWEASGRVLFFPSIIRLRRGRWMRNAKKQHVLLGGLLWRTLEPYGKRRLATRKKPCWRCCRFTVPATGCRRFRELMQN